VLFGDPAKAGPFVMRLKFPAGTKIAPHFHPADELVTVLSGAIRFGHGRTMNLDEAKLLGPAGFFAMPKGMVHFASADTDSIVEIHGAGPWGITYVNAD
jgi:quercetin dioxygenase-like cupin family protein